MKERRNAMIISLYIVHFLDAYGEECRIMERGTSKRFIKHNFLNWMPQGKLLKIEWLRPAQ